MELSYTDSDHALTVLKGLPRFDACVVQSTFQPIPPLVTAAVIYLLLTTVLTQISTAVEHRMDVEGRQK